jgi:xylan 1,4-beta-xylosidase
VKRFISFLLYSATLAAVAAGSLIAAESRRPERYCNPLPIPNYPVGKLARDIIKGELNDGGLWLAERKEQYRELADPTALWFEGAWYLYPSVDMAWVSRDEGRTWEHHPLNVRDIGYAPTIVRHGERFLLMGSFSEVYESDSPLGPFHPIGALQISFGQGKLPVLIDPMLFSDDGRLFLYWGCTPNGGIWGVELDATEITRPLGEPQEMIPFLPDTFPWEALGNRNQSRKVGWMEGGWMVKHDGRYHLTYSSAGTQYRTYAMGCYVGDSPLGPFRPQARNPIFRNTEGFITGTGHGCIVKGPSDRYWTIYTVLAAVAHGFERRLGMDPVAFDADGNLYVPAATSTPQPVSANADVTPWVPLNDGEPTLGSSCAPNSAGRLAADYSMMTWWLPAADDAQPVLTTSFPTSEIHAVRVVWRDVGLDTPKGVRPGAFRYRVEAETSPGTWATIVDRSESTEDFLIDYRECAPTVAGRARLVVLGHPQGIQPAVAEFTVFGPVR